VRGAGAGPAVVDGLSVSRRARTGRGKRALGSEGNWAGPLSRLEGAETETPWLVLKPRLLVLVASALHIVLDRDPEPPDREPVPGWEDDDIPLVTSA